jgi:hypothetical protein
MGQTQETRLHNVNEFIRFIGDHGRRFFYHKGTYAHMTIDLRGRVWFVDDYTEERIYTHRSGHWRGFSHGGTLRNLVEVFRDHIKKGVQIHPSYLTTKSWMGSEHPWGYPNDSLKILHAEGLRRGLIPEQEQDDE